MSPAHLGIVVCLAVADCVVWILEPSGMRFQRHDQYTPIEESCNTEVDVSRKNLLHLGMYDQESRYGSSNDEQNQEQDEESSMPASLRVRLGDAEGLDEGVGKEVKDFHRLIISPR